MMRDSFAAINISLLAERKNMGKLRAINMLLLRSKDRSAKYVIALIWTLCATEKLQIRTRLPKRRQAAALQRFCYTPPFVL